MRLGTADIHTSERERFPKWKIVILLFIKKVLLYLQLQFLSIFFVCLFFTAVVDGDVEHLPGLI